MEKLYKYHASELNKGIGEEDKKNQKQINYLAIIN